MKNKSVSILIFLILIISSFLFGLSVSALELNWPTSPMGTDLKDNSKLPEMVKYFYEWGIAIGGIAVFIALLIGGFLYLTSAGDPGRLREAKDRIFSALTGLALLLGSWLILNTINPELTVLRPPSFEKPVVGIESGLLESAVEKKSCRFVKLYKEPYWKGEEITVSAMSDPPQVDLGKFYPKSLRMFRSCEPEREVCIDGILHYVVTSTVATTTETGEATTTEIATYASTTFVCLQSELSPPLAGDVNGDCYVDQTDVILCLDCIKLLAEGKIAVCDYDCDFDDDGTIEVIAVFIKGLLAGVGGDDGNVIKNNFGKFCGCLREGGACTVEFYEEGDPEWWDVFGHILGTKYCKDKKGNVSASVYNVKIAYFSDKPIKCVKVFKSGLEE